jgi:hypothetical protein
MKKLIVSLSLVLLYLTPSNELPAQTSKQMMDSCRVYQKNKDFHTALEWAIKADSASKNNFGEADTNNIHALEQIGFCYFNMP